MRRKNDIKNHWIKLNETLKFIKKFIQNNLKKKKKYFTWIISSFLVAKIFLFVEVLENKKDWSSNFNYSKWENYNKIKSSTNNFVILKISKWVL